MSQDEDIVNKELIWTHIALGGGYNSASSGGEFVLTIKDSDLLADVQAAFLSRFGRAVGQQSVAAIKDRLNAIGQTGFKGRFAGHALPEINGESFSRETFSPTAPSEMLNSRSFVSGMENEVASHMDGGSHAGQISHKEVISGTAFSLTTENEDGSLLSLWSRGSRSGFESQENNIDLEADMTTFLLGADWKRESQLLGVMFLRSHGESDYTLSSNDTGEMEADLNAFVPYFAWSGDKHTSWASFGFGQGDMTFLLDGLSSSITTDIDWHMLAGGSTGELGAAHFLGDAQLSWNADVLWTETLSDSADGLSATDSHTTRLRVGLESRWSLMFGPNNEFTPRLEIGARYDGGDAEQGSGVEIGGGVDWSNPLRGIEIGVEGRTLVFHEEEAKNWGFSFNFAYDRNPQSKRGFQAEISNNYGSHSSGGASALLNPELFPQISETTGASTWSAEMAYGLSRDNGMVGAPYTRLSGSRRVGFGRMRLGYRIEPDALSANRLTVDLWTEPEMGNGHNESSSAGLELHSKF